LDSTSSQNFETIGHLRLRTDGLCLALKQRFMELQARDFPDDGASQAITLLEDLLTAVELQIPRVTDEPTLILIGWTIIQLGQTLEYFDNAGTDQTPRGLVCLLQSLYWRLNRQSTLLAWPQANYNFTIRSLVEFLKELFQNFGVAEINKVFASYNGPQYMVSFPRVERDNVLMHAVFGHELGHEIANNFLAHEAGTASHQAAAVSIWGKVVGALGKLPLSELQNAIQTVFRLRQRALQELLSDIVGVYIFGPSALFAAHELHTSSDLDATPSLENDYPPGRMRIRVSLEASDEEGYLSALSSHSNKSTDDNSFLAAATLVKRLREISASDNDKNALAIDPLVDIAYEWAEDTLSEAKKFARQEVGAALYSARTLSKEVPQLVQRLKSRLPPNEIGNSLTPTPVDERSSVLAAWLFFLEESQSSTSLDSKRKKLKHLNEMALRGLEYIVLQRNYLVSYPGDAQ
jgi:hypothetical protein